MNKKIIFSGVQPSGNLHLGNYLGAISQWVKMQAEYDCIFCVVDYHAITVKQDPQVLREKIIDIAKIYIASGIDPKKSIIFKQSDIKEHTELAWILNSTVTRMNDLFNMTQFKEKAGIQKERNLLSIANTAMDKTQQQLSELKNNIKTLKKDGDLNIKEIFNSIIKGLENAQSTTLEILNLDKKNEKENSVGVGLFDYPVLMASDILLYNTDIVPVGDDQSQHVELTRTLARRFNDQFGETFKVPEARLQKHGARIMGLDDPTKKMSKSSKSEWNYIALTDDIEKAKKKIMRATTDSESLIKHDPEKKPGISNLLTIYALLENSGDETMDGIKALEKRYIGKSYGDFKKDLAEVVATFLTKFQESYYNIKNSDIEKFLQNGAKKLQPIAKEVINRVKNKIGSI